MAVSMTTEHAQNSAHPCEDPSRLLLEDIFSYSRVMIAFYVHSCMQLYDFYNDASHPVPRARHHDVICRMH